MSCLKAKAVKGNNNSLPTEFNNKNDEQKGIIAEPLETVTASFKNERRILIKFGKLMNIRIKRFYTLHNDILMYYTTASSPKPKSSFNLSGCTIKKDYSKIKTMVFSLRITTQSKKTFWLHASCDAELPLLEKYLRCVNEGLFNQDKIIKQFLSNNNEPENMNTQQHTTKHDKQQCTSAFSSNVQIPAIPSSTLNPSVSNSQNKASNPDGVLPINSNPLSSFIVSDELKSEALLAQNAARRPSAQKLSYNSQMKELEPISEKAGSNLQVPIEHLGSVHHKIGGSEMSWSEQHELREKRASLASRHLCSFGGGCTGVYPDNHCKRESIKNAGQASLPVPQQEYSAEQVAKIGLENAYENSIKNIKLIEDSTQSGVKLLFEPTVNSQSADKDLFEPIIINQQRTTTVNWPLGRSSHNEFNMEKSLSPRKKHQSQQLYPGEYIITLGPQSQENNIFTMQGSSCEKGKGSSDIKNKFIGLDLHKDVLSHQVIGTIPSGDCMDLDADVHFPSDEECQQLKNEKLEVVGLNYKLHSGYAQAHKDYFPSNTGNSFLQSIHSAGVHDPFQQHFQHGNTNKMYLDFDEQLLVQQDFIPDKFGGGTCNLSSGTLQNWCIADLNPNNRIQQQQPNQQQQQQQQQTDSPQGSLFSNPFSSNSHLPIHSQALPQPGSNRSPFSSTCTTTQNTVVKLPSGKNQWELSKVHDEEENISSDEVEEETPSSNFAIKQQAFCAGGSRIFIQEENEQVLFQKKSSSNNKSIRNSRIGVITDYSFDKKTVSDTDLFEQEEGNFQRTIYDNSDLKQNPYSIAPEEDQILQHHPSVAVLGESGNHNNNIPEEEDDENPTAAQNITQIIQNYQEQNYHANVHHHEPISVEQQPNSEPPQQHINKSATSPEERQILRQRIKRSLSIDAEQCNWQYENERHAAYHKEVPQIKDKKEFYNKKNVTAYLMPKMEEILPFLSGELSEAQCFTEGYYYLWSFQFENAREVFSLHRETNAQFEMALLEENLLRIVVSGSKELIVETETKFAKLLEYLLACQKDIVKKGSQSSIKCLITISPMALDLMKAEIHIIRGLLQSLLNNKFQAFLSFKNAYSRFSKVKHKINPNNSETEAQLLQHLDVQSLSRFYFLQGIFNIGLSMIPSTFLKILSLIGVSPNKQLGYESLEKCAQLESIRSSYASLLLAIEYTELNPNLDKSIPIIKKMIKQLPQCPLFYWLAALLSWRYAKPDDALNLINKSLWNCGEHLGRVSYYLKFEKGWFSVSQFDWRAAAKQFEEIIIVALEIDTLDFEMLLSLASSKKISHQVVDLIRPLVQTAKNTITQAQKIILPHKCCLAALIACCYETMGLIDYMNLWLLMTAYINKKQSDSKTQVDEEISKLCAKYLTRANKQFIKYEMLYFVKEITKLREDMLSKMVAEIEGYYITTYSHIDVSAYPKLLEKVPQTAIDFSSTVLLRIVGGCLQQDYNKVYEAGRVLDKIAEFVPSDHSYILHHSYHWLGRCYQQQSLLIPAREHLRKCLKYRKSEFSLENKTAKLLEELDSMQAQK